MSRVLVLAALTLSACNSAEPAWTSTPGAYDVLDAGERERVASARAAEADGDLEGAADELRGVLAARPTNLAVATFLQEVELARAVAATDDPAGARDALAAAYLTRAEEGGDATSLVLAARMELDLEASLGLLERALAADPACNWAQYARAYQYYRAGRLAEARAALDAALELDGGHLPSRRLRAAILARGESPTRAARELEAWIAAAAGDPTVSPRRVAEARVDLASVVTLSGDPERALELLAGVDGALLASPARAELVRAAVLDELGRPAEALAAVRRAAEAEPTELLPLLQQAMLLAHGDATVAEQVEAWETLLEAAGAETGADGELGADLEALLLRLQAHAQLERLEVESAP